jgi:hypothetical protein
VITICMYLLCNFAEETNYIVSTIESAQYVALVEGAVFVSSIKTHISAVSLVEMYSYPVFD